MYVFDSWALLAWLQDERPASLAVEQILDNSAPGDLMMSLIHAGEIYYIVAKSRSRDRADEIRNVLAKMPIELVSVTDALIWQAAALKSRHPLSYADAFAAALALDKQRTLVTGDREFESVEAAEGLSIKWLTRQ